MNDKTEGTPMHEDSGKTWTGLLSGIVAAGFLAWSGVIWAGLSDARTFLDRTQEQVREIAVLVKVQGEQLQSLATLMRAHDALPAHREAVGRLDRMEREIDALKPR